MVGGTSEEYIDQKSSWISLVSKKRTVGSCKIPDGTSSRRTYTGFKLHQSQDMDQKFRNSYFIRFRKIPNSDSKFDRCPALQITTPNIIKVKLNLEKSFSWLTRTRPSPLAGVPVYSINSIMVYGGLSYPLLLLKYKGYKFGIRASFRGYTETKEARDPADSPNMLNNLDLDLQVHKYKQTHYSHKSILLSLSSVKIRADFSDQQQAFSRSLSAIIFRINIHFIENITFYIIEKIRMSNGGIRIISRWTSSFPKATNIFPLGLTPIGWH